MSSPFAPPGECPVCGETVPRQARACPGCGADERSGWDEEASRYDGVDLPAAAFSAEADPSPAHSGSNRGFWLAVTLGVLAAVIMTLVFRR